MITDGHRLEHLPADDLRFGKTPILRHTTLSFRKFHRVPVGNLGGSLPTGFLSATLRRQDNEYKSASRIVVVATRAAIKKPQPSSVTWFLHPTGRLQTLIVSDIDH
jgi:hypothetical protein